MKIPVKSPASASRRRSRPVPGGATRRQRFVDDERLPRHHRVPGQGHRCRRLHGRRRPHGHLRPGAPGGHGDGPGHGQLRLLALGDVQQRGQQGRLHRRARWRWLAHVQRDRGEPEGRRRDLRHRRRPARLQELLQDPRTQSATENCVAHNGSLIPIKGKDIMVQAWYQGGISVWDFTDSAHPVELAWFDRGPLSADRLILGGSWSAYYYNGYVFSNDIQQGLDVLNVHDSRLAGAKGYRWDEFNPQSQAVFPK
ncbi:hypothetical protein NKG05_11375 [Oerskovia sp. M15]